MSIPIRKSVKPDALYREMLAEELLRRAAARDPFAPIHALGRVPEALIPDHQTQEDIGPSDSVSPETKMQIATTMLADEGIRNERVRAQYDRAVTENRDITSAERSALKKAARKKKRRPL